MDYLLLQIMAGIAKGMNIFLLCAGFTIIYGVLRVVNLAHPSLYLMAGFFAFSITQIFGNKFGYWAALVLAPIFSAVIGMIVERVVFRTVYNKHHYMQLLLGWGVMLILGDIMKLTWGVSPKSIPVPAILTGTVKVPGGSFPYTLIFAVIVSALIGLGVYLLMYRSRLGTLIRALSYDEEATKALGVRVNLLWIFVFGFCSWLAGVGGTVASLFTSIRLGADQELVLICFIVVIVGGLGSTIGALVGSLIFGIVFSLGIMVLPRYALVFMYVIMVAMLIIRPYGLFGKKID
jgi:branched-subunit amino acid ABC-type transport system permease component